MVIARCDYGPRDEKRCKKSLKNPASSNPDHSLYMKRNATDYGYTENYKERLTHRHCSAMPGKKIKC